MDKMKIGVIGAGHISDTYLDNMINTFDMLEVVCITSKGMEHAREFADRYGIIAVTVDEMLKDPSIDMIVNLTPPTAHFSIISKALNAGKHVYTEKVIAPTLKEAEILISLAKSKGLYLGSAPDTFLGAAVQTAREAVDGNEIGSPTSFTVTLNRDLGVLYEVLKFLIQPGSGIGYDMGVYYLTAVLSILGPVETVCGIVQTNKPERKYKSRENLKFGQKYTIENENMMAATVRLKNGVLGTVLFNGDSIFPEQPHISIHGTKGIIYLPNPNYFGGEVRIFRSGKKAEEVLPVNHCFVEESRGIGVAEMAKAIQDGRPCRASSELACHVIELLEGVMESSRTGKYYTLTTTFERPKLLTNEETF